MWPQRTRRGCTRSIAARTAVEPTEAPAEVRSATPLGGEWHDQDVGALHAVEQRLGLGLVQVAGPGAEGRARHGIAEAEEGEAGALRRPAMQDGRGACGGAEFIGAFGVAGDQHGLGQHRRQLGHGLVQAAALGAEIAGADDEVGLGRRVADLGRAAAREVHVRKGEDAGHGRLIWGVSYRWRLAVEGAAHGQEVEPGQPLFLGRRSR